jgi:hypothetical protein
MELESLELLWQKAPLPTTLPNHPQDKKGRPFRSMTHLIGCMEILFVKLATTIFGLD